jgi:hypothetical protein
LASNLLLQERDRLYETLRAESARANALSTALAAAKSRVLELERVQPTPETPSQLVDSIRLPERNPVLEALVGELSRNVQLLQSEKKGLEEQLNQDRMVQYLRKQVCSLKELNSN